MLFRLSACQNARKNAKKNEGGHCKSIYFRNFSGRNPILRIMNPGGAVADRRPGGRALGVEKRAADGHESDGQACCGRHAAGKPRLAGSHAGGERLVFLGDMAFKPVLGIAQEGMNIARTITHFVERLAQRLQIFSVHGIVIEEVDPDFPGNALFGGEMVLQIIEQAVERIQKRPVRFRNTPP
jgi:hypothetical protein